MQGNQRMETRALARGRLIASRELNEPAQRVLCDKENANSAIRIGKANASNMAGKPAVKYPVANKQGAIGSRQFGVVLSNANAAIKDKPDVATKNKFLDKSKVIEKPPRPSIGAPSIGIRKSMKKPAKVSALIKRTVEKKKAAAHQQAILKRNGNNVKATNAAAIENRTLKNKGTTATAMSMDTKASLPSMAQSRQQRALLKHYQLRRRAISLNPSNPLIALPTTNRLLGRNKNTNGLMLKCRRADEASKNSSFDTSKEGTTSLEPSIPTTVPVPVMTGSSGSSKEAVLSKSKPRSERAFSTTVARRSELYVRNNLFNDREGEEDLPSIDQNDVDNELAVVEYVDDIHNFYWHTEEKYVLPLNYMCMQTEISPRMRAVLVNWLIDVHYMFKLLPETLFLMTTILDKFLSMQKVSKKELQLSGLTALLIAAKYEEIWPPTVNDLVTVSNYAFTGQQIRDMEKMILKTLKFNLASLPTPYVFLRRFLKAAEADKQTEDLAFYLAELSLTEYPSLQWKPSLLAASSVNLARQMLNKRPCWTRLLQKHAKYDEAEMKECINKLFAFHKNAGTSEFKAVESKYSSPTYGAVAKLFSSSRHRA